MCNGLRWVRQRSSSTPKRKTLLFAALLSVLLLGLPSHAYPEDVIVSWNPNEEPDLAGYRIYYGSASGSHSVMIEVSGTSAYTLTHLEPGQTYYFSATAYDTSGNESAFSEEVSFYMPTGGTGATDNGDGDSDGIEDAVDNCPDHANADQADADGDGMGDVCDSFTDSDADGMPDEWETQNGLNPEVNDASGDADDDGISNLAEYQGGTDPTVYDGNSEPEAPVAHWPVLQQTVSLTPELQTEDFYDPDSGDIHLQTQWQITRVADERLVLDIKSVHVLTSLTVPRLVLQEDGLYSWRTRFYDNHGKASEWSQPAEFSTQLQWGDTDGNGIPDDQQVDALLDLDEDGTSDPDQEDIKCVNVEGADGQVGISVRGSTSVAAIEALESMNPSDPQFEARSSGGPEEMPFGLIHFRLRTDEPGAEATVTVHLSEPAPEGSKWYKFDPIAGTWLDYSDHAVLSSDRRSVSLTLVDGGIGDLDGTANGIIIDPSGLGAPSVSENPDSGNALADTIADITSKASCFIGAASQQVPRVGSSSAWLGVYGHYLAIIFPVLIALTVARRPRHLRARKAAAGARAAICMLLLVMLTTATASAADDTTAPDVPAGLTVTLRSGAGEEPGPAGGQDSDGWISACVKADETYSANLSCPGDKTISRIDFASYGLPAGSCSDGYSEASCHAVDSQSIVVASCLGQAACAVGASNAVFGDPCAGTRKRLAIAYTCGGGGDDAPSYTLTVNNGSGDGDYQAGAGVTITAETAPSGKVFDQWQVTSGHPQIANAGAATTELTMPSSAVAVTATYRDEEGGLGGALGSLLDHITGAATLSATQLQQQQEAVIAHDVLFESNEAMIADALAVVSAYESSRGPLWLNDKTRNVNIPREAGAGFELAYAMMAVMQGLIDHAYVPGNLSRFRDVLDGAMFETSRYFPGAVDPPVNPSVAYEVQINASQPAKWGSPVMYDDDPVRRPTGCYVAPGSIVTVDVPASIVSKGYSIRVGAHSWDLSNKPRYERLDRISLLYPVDATRTLVGNPLGGGIYIEVPPLADAGIVTLTITNAVRSPFYSKKPFHMTSLAEWLDTERHHPAPWADFESEKFMMQVPTNWIYAYASPDVTMENWDKAMDTVSDLMGKPRIRNGQTVLYMQVDVIIKGGAYHPGYPMSNDPYDPLRDERGNKDHFFLTGPRKGTSTTFHELGHAELFTKFPGEVEAVVNLPYVAVMNQGFGFSLDRAFSLSMGNKETISLDQAAIMWMVTENFRQGNPMNITNSTKNEVRYQQRGYGKYVEIASLFGWGALNDFWTSVNLDYLDGITYNRNNDEADSRILRMSRTAGADLRPLVHFWGVHPNNDENLKSAMQSEGLMPPALIYDRLMHYSTLIPMNNAEFIEHADIVYPERDGTGNPDYGKGWYGVWDDLYDESHGTAAQAALQDIIDHYFPDGRPAD